MIRAAQLRRSSFLRGGKLAFSVLKLWWFARQKPVSIVNGISNQINSENNFDTRIDRSIDLILLTEAQQGHNASSTHVSRRSDVVGTRRVELPRDNLPFAEACLAETVRSPCAVREVRKRSIDRSPTSGERPHLNRNNMVWI